MSWPACEASRVGTLVPTELRGRHDMRLAVWERGDGDLERLERELPQAVAIAVELEYSGQTLPGSQGPRPRLSVPSFEERPEARSSQPDPMLPVMLPCGLSNRGHEHGNTLLCSGFLDAAGGTRPPGTRIMIGSERVGIGSVEPSGVRFGKSCSSHTRRLRDQVSGPTPS